MPDPLITATPIIGWRVDASAQGLDVIDARASGDG